MNSFLQINNQNVQWFTDSDFTLDVAEFEQLIHQTKEYANKNNNKEFITGALERAVDLYKGDLFPECYDSWIEPLRSTINVKYKEALGKLIRLHEQARSYPKAIHYAERLLATDNLREKTYLDLMRLHALNRNRAKSIKVYHQKVRLLELRATISLFKLYQKQGEADPGGKKLRTIYKKSTEGHSTPDLKEAAHLLNINI